MCVTCFVGNFWELYSLLAIVVSDSRRLSGGVSRETHETREKGLHHACHLRTQGPHVRPSSRRLESHAFRRRHSARPCASLRSAQVPGSPGGPVHAGEDAGRAADGGVPRARRPKELNFRAVDGGAPLVRSMVASPVQSSSFRVFRVFRGKWL